MRISIIGSGNVGTVLARRLKAGGHVIHEVVSRQPDHAEQLAQIVGASPVAGLKDIDKSSDVYLICTSDNAIESVARQLQVGERLVAHTAGSVARDVLANASTNYGVLYPLQTLRKELTTEPRIPLVVDGNNEWSTSELASIARSVTDQVLFADDEQRSALHLAAVIVNNFSNHLYTLAEKYCEQNQLNFHDLLPLVEESVARLRHASPGSMQTGPAARNDTATIAKHLDMLRSYPQLANIYRTLSDAISSYRTSE